MSEGGGRELWGLRIAAGLSLLLAFLPGEWLTGVLAEGDSRRLDLGLWIHRGAFVLLAAWLAFFPPGKRGRSKERAWKVIDLLGLGVLALAARLPGLGAQLWFDEMWMVVDYVRHPLAEVLRSYPSDNNHPLYSLLATASAKVFGESPESLRLPALVFGVLGVLMMHVFAAGLVGRRRSFLAALLLAFSFHHISFSLNARGYTGMVFFALLSSHALLQGLKGRERAWWLFGFALAMGIWLHLTLLFVAVGQALMLLGWALFSRQEGRGRTLGRAFGGFSFGAILTIACHALILPQMVDQLLLKKKVVAAAARWTDPLWLFEEIALSFGLGLVPGVIVLGIAGVVLLIGLYSAWREAPAVVALLVIPGVVSTAAFLALGRNLWPRLYFFLAGFLVLTVTLGAFGMLRLCPKRWGGGHPILERGLEAFLVLVALATLMRGWAPKQDFEGALRHLETTAEGSSVVTVGLATLPYSDYRDRGYRSVESVEEFEAIFPRGNAGYLLNTFPIFMESRHPELWKRILERAVVEKSFPGSIGGGEVVVYRIRP